MAQNNTSYILALHPKVVEKLEAFGTVEYNTDVASGQRVVLVRNVYGNIHAWYDVDTDELHDGIPPYMDPTRVRVHVSGLQNTFKTFLSSGVVQSDETVDEIFETVLPADAKPEELKIPHPATGSAAMGEVRDTLRDFMSREKIFVDGTFNQADKAVDDATAERIMKDEKVAPRVVIDDVGEDEEDDAIEIDVVEEVEQPAAKDEPVNEAPEPSLGDIVLQALNKAAHDGSITSINFTAKGGISMSWKP